MKPDTASGLKISLAMRKNYAAIGFSQNPGLFGTRLTIPASSRRSKLRGYANQEAHNAEFNQVSLREARCSTTSRCNVDAFVFLSPASNMGSLCHAEKLICRKFSHLGTDHA
jgi:hypothetical protein